MHTDETRASIEAAAYAVREGGVIAYPTEAVFGLGCLPGNTEALERILAIKGRAANKGLILIAGERSQLSPWMGDVSAEHLPLLDSWWPGPVTVVVPASDAVPTLLNGDRKTLAVRHSAFDTVRELCERCDSALVSTSANRAGQSPLLNHDAVVAEFGDAVDAVVKAPTGGARLPSRIIDLLTGRVLRD